MIRLPVPAAAFLVLAGVLSVGCDGSARQPAGKPINGKAAPEVGPALPKQDDHAGHDHADHDHAGHDHADHGATGETSKGEAMAEGDHEGHDHPDSLADLVAELDRLAAVVRGGLEKGVREEADSAVHEFGHLVEDVEPLAKEAKLPEGVEATVVKAGSDLFDAFDKLDQAIHGSGDVAEAWKGQAAAIDAALKTLKDAVAK